MSTPDDLDRRIAALVRAAGADAPELPPWRSGIAVVGDRSDRGPGTPPQPPRRPAWRAAAPSLGLAAAAVLVVALVLLSIVVSRSHHDRVIVDVPATPVPTTPDATTPDPTTPGTTTPGTTTPGTVATTEPTGVTESAGADPCIDAPLAPTLLPDGSAPGAPVVEGTGSDRIARWGTGADEVRQRFGAPVTDPRFDTGPAAAGRVLDGVSFDVSVFVRTGNPPAAAVTIQTLDPSGCAREYEVGPGVAFVDAWLYADTWRFTADDRRPKVAPTDGSTLLAARSTDPIAHPRATVAPLGDLDPDLVAMSPTGQIVAGRREGDTVRLVVRVDDRWVDTDVTVPVTSTTSPPLLEFGPSGDLYVLATRTDTLVPFTVEVTRVRLTGDGTAEVIDHVTRTSEDMNCHLVVEAAHVGCATGEAMGLDLDPAVPFDHAVVDPVVQSVLRSGPSGERTWRLTFDPPIAPGCTNDRCFMATTLGPAGQVLWDVPVEDAHAPTQRVVYVLDDRPIAGVVWLDSGVHVVLGLDGTDLLATYVAADGTSIERFDVAPALGDEAG